MVHRLGLPPLTEKRPRSRADKAFGALERFLEAAAHIFFVVPPDTKWWMRIMYALAVIGPVCVLVWLVIRAL